MKYALLSDVHSNLEAFQAVIKDLEGERVDHVCFLGDIVGYGVDPAQCIDILQGLTSWIVAGNHDWATVRLTDTSYFNSAAKKAVDWTTKQLSPSHRKFLKNLPLTCMSSPDTTGSRNTSQAGDMGLYFFFAGGNRWIKKLRTADLFYRPLPFTSHLCGKQRGESLSVAR